MIKCALFAPVLLAMCVVAHAEDQAVLACENIIKAELIAPKSYEAVSKSAIGGVVSVTYDAVNKYNAPIRATEQCEFSQTAAGWVIKSSYSEDGMKTEFAGLIEKVKSGALDKTDAEKQIPAIEKRYSDILIREAARELRARQAGPYPIPPSATSLSR